MTVLIACEESQTVCKAFRARGYEAYSCDIQEPSGGHPEWHILGDAVEALRGGRITTMDGQNHDVGRWDLVIAHPPCTFISNAGACRLYPKKGEINWERFAKGLKGKLFFMVFYLYGWFGVGKIVIENPVPSRVFEMPEYTQIVQPYEYGDPWSKKTLLWEFWSKAAYPDKYFDEIQALCCMRHQPQQGQPGQGGCKPCWWCVKGKK